MILHTLTKTSSGLLTAFFDDLAVFTLGYTRNVIGTERKTPLHNARITCLCICVWCWLNTATSCIWGSKLWKYCFMDSRAVLCSGTIRELVCEYHVIWSEKSDWLKIMWLETQGTCSCSAEKYLLEILFKIGSAQWEKNSCSLVLLSSVVRFPRMKHTRTIMS